MAAQKEDRRIRRTKRLLRQSLAELMNEKEFKDITVKEITDRADLNRGTFYFHYTDTYDLREKIEDELAAEFAAVTASYTPTPDNYSARPMLEKAVHFMQEQRYYIRTMFCGKASSRLQDKFMSVIEETITHVQEQLHLTETEQQKQYHCRFCAYGIIGCLTMWLESGDGMSGETLVNELDEMISRVVAV